MTLRYKHLLSAAVKGRLLGGSYHFCPSVLGTLPRIATGDGRLLLSGRKLKISKTLGSSRVLVTDTRASAALKVAAIKGPVIHASLARDFACFIGFEPHAAPVLQLEDGSFALFHFLGASGAPCLRS
jgi:hypothetical protein